MGFNGVGARGVRQACACVGSDWLKTDPWTGVARNEWREVLRCEGGVVVGYYMQRVASCHSDVQRVTNIAL